jgi:hypothetical protein
MSREKPVGSLTGLPRGFPRCRANSAWLEQAGKAYFELQVKKWLVSIHRYVVLIKRFRDRSQPVSTQVVNCKVGDQWCRAKKKADVPTETSALFSLYRIPSGLSRISSGFVL